MTAPHARRDGRSGECRGTVIAGRCPSCELWPDAIEALEAAAEQVLALPPRPWTEEDIAALVEDEMAYPPDRVEPSLPPESIPAPAPGRRMVPRYPSTSAGDIGEAIEEARRRAQEAAWSQLGAGGWDGDCG